MGIKMIGGGNIITITINSPIRANETKVMATFMAPIPRVADWLCEGSEREFEIVES